MVSSAETPVVNVTPSSRWPLDGQCAAYTSNWQTSGTGERWQRSLHFCTLRDFNGSPVVVQHEIFVDESVSLWKHQFWISSCIQMSWQMDGVSPSWTRKYVGSTLSQHEKQEHQPVRIDSNSLWCSGIRGISEREVGGRSAGQCHSSIVPTEGRRHSFLDTQHGGPKEFAMDRERRTGSPF